jgi:prolipoprotein diacylglyceryl transferase
MVTDRRWQARGGAPGQIGDMSVWLIPGALIGARIYHLITSPDEYFGSGGHPWQALEIWKGGLGLWGGLIGGPLAGWWWCRRHGVDPVAVLDCAAPAVPVAQAIGRLGNWFNQELYGGPTTLPWALRIDPAHRPAATPNSGLYHPTFLYEMGWNLLLVVPLVLWAERRFQLRGGRAFALYVALYTAGRAWIEEVRVDPAHTFLGLRVNDYVSIVVFAAAVGFLLWRRPRPPHAGEPVETPSRPAETTLDA